MALIRYPGSKHKLADEIWAAFPDAMTLPLHSSELAWEYREPFFGAGAIGFRVLSVLHPRVNVWLNDFDFGIASLWSTIRQPESLRQFCEKIAAFEPSVEAFERYKEHDGDRSIGEVEAAFRKLALHRISFSGLGVMAGGPIGGADQSNATYKVGCRWRPEKLRSDAVRYHKLLRKFPSCKITCGDFEHVLAGANERTFIYLDPPYYEKGPELYKHSMSDADHERLASKLKDAPFHWVLSYDDHTAIRDLYSWAEIKEVKITYTTAIAKNGDRPKNKEVVITPKVARRAN